MIYDLTYISRLEENIELANIVPTPHDSPLTTGYTPRSDEGRITLAELMETYTTLSNKVTQLENELSTTKVVYNKAFITLTNRVKKLESQLTRKGVVQSFIAQMKKDQVKQGEVHETAEHSRDDDDETLAETLLNIKMSLVKDKVKGIMQEIELPKKLKKKEMTQLSLDEELAQKLYHALKNKPFLKAKVRKNMIMYLKNQGGYKQSYFKGMKYEDIRPLFERKWDQVHTFVPKNFEIEREVMKRVGFNLQQGSSKKQRIVPEEDTTIEAIPLAIKPLVIIEYKIVKEGKISTYHITRADGSTRRYTSMINLLENIDREDLETLWKLVKDNMVIQDQKKGMKESYREISKLCLSQTYRVRFKNLHIFLLVDNVYPLTPATINMMLERKLQADQWNEMCY
nr:hypothetical protein [Tanacetum cinerariifolium]